MDRLTLFIDQVFTTELPVADGFNDLINFLRQWVFGNGSGLVLCFARIGACQ